jgi:integrase
LICDRHNWCFVLRPEVTEGNRLRRVPVHKHLVEQGFLEYVEDRRSIGKPLFYEPSRARGGKGVNPQSQKVGERLAERIRESLKVTAVHPNHGWRHLWREIVRGTRMKPELCDYMCGHESKSGTGADTASARCRCLPRRCRSFRGSKYPRSSDRRRRTSAAVELPQK